MAPVQKSLLSTLMKTQQSIEACPLLVVDQMSKKKLVESLEGVGRRTSDIVARMIAAHYPISTVTFRTIYHEASKDSGAERGIEIQPIWLSNETDRAWDDLVLLPINTVRYQ